MSCVTPLAVSCPVLLDRSQESGLLLPVQGRTTASPLLVVVLRMWYEYPDDGVARANRTSQYNAPSGVIDEASLQPD